MNQHEYTIERHTYGLLVKAAPDRPGVPMDALMEVSKMARKDAVIHVGVANALGAVFAIGKKSDMAKWADEIEANIEKQGVSKEAKWLSGTRTGTSSKTIFFTLVRPSREPCNFDPDRPYDADDFSRCLHLVTYMGWENRLPEVSAKYPVWEPIVREWPKLAKAMADGNTRSVTEFLHNLPETK